MLVNFHIEKLDRLLSDFHRLTGLTVSIWDADFRMLSHQPKEMCGFCRLIRSSPDGVARCYASDKAVCMRCAVAGEPVTHRCHAGLVDTAIPIRFKERVLGYMMFGQVSDPVDRCSRTDLERMARELLLPIDELLFAYEQLESYDSERLTAAANLLKMATRYLWLSEYIEIGYNTLASRIDEYIRENLTRPISVQELCRHFAISKNRLYALAHEWFKMSIGDYIIASRIGEAKRLLATTDFSVGEISSRVGVRDYNYFIKFFKDRVGIPPLKYRKQAPFGE